MWRAVVASIAICQDRPGGNGGAGRLVPDEEPKRGGGSDSEEAGPGKH